MLLWLELELREDCRIVECVCVCRTGERGRWFEMERQLYVAVRV